MPCDRQVREIVRSPAGEPVSPGATLKSVKITARVGSLGSDVLVVPRRPTADSEVRRPVSSVLPRRPTDAARCQGALTV